MDERVRVVNPRYDRARKRRRWEGNREKAFYPTAGEGRIESILKFSASGIPGREVI